MAAGSVLFLIKFFSEERFAEEFLQGRIFLNRLSYFREIESEDDGRADPNEAVAMWWQPHDIQMTISVPGFPDINITKDDLAGPISTSSTYHDHLHLFCMYAVRTLGFDFRDGKFECPDEDSEKLQEQVRIDERCMKFGDFAVITDAALFKCQLEKALQICGHSCRAKLVEYYDDEVFHGEINFKDIPFSKQKKYRYQNEYRVCIDTKLEGTTPLILEIGRIDQFAKKISSSQLPDILKLTKLEPAL